MFAIRIGAIMVCFFHLVIHAFFKALMFMCVGGVIFYRGGVQDARFLNGLWFKMPLTCGLLVLRNLSLIGFPFLSGFYSKELILGIYLLGEFPLVGVLYLFISLVLTMGYSIRIIKLIIRGTEVTSIQHYKERHVYYAIALLIMSRGAVLTGVLIQLLRKELLFFENLNPIIFYQTLTLVVFWFLNLVLLRFVNLSLVYKKMGVYILRKM